MRSLNDMTGETTARFQDEIDTSFSITERVEKWAAGEIGRSQREERWFLSRFGNQLEMWLREELANKNGSRRSLKLPAGQVGIRSIPAGFIVIDEAALAEWCCWNLQDALRVRIDATGSSACFLRHYLRGRELNLTVRETVSVAEVKKALEASGELPPGVSLTSPSDRFYVK